MIRTSHRLPRSCPVTTLVLCLLTACPVLAGASLEVGYFDDGDWVTLSGTASGVMRICVRYMPPPGKQATGVSLQQIRITDKRGEHTIPVQFDAGVPLQGGKAAAYLWRSFLNTNGPISIEADGTASTFAPPPVGSGMESFSVSCSCQSENLTVVSLTNNSDLAQWGLVAFSPDSATHSVTATLADAPDPHGPASDVGSVSVGLLNIGPDGLGSVAWSANWPGEQLGQGGEYTGSLISPPNIPLVYAPNAGALQVDEDAHSWYSPYVKVQGLSLSRFRVWGERSMDVWLDHTGVLLDGTDPSELGSLTVSMSPLAQVGSGLGWLSCGEGPQTDLVIVSPCLAAGTYRLFVVGSDGHGGVSKYSGSVEQPVAPAATEFTIPSASCISGSTNEGGEFPEAQSAVYSQYQSLGWVHQPTEPPEEAEPPDTACFYSARYVFGQGWRGGRQNRPERDHTLEMLFADDVVIFNGHGNTYWIQNELGDEVTYTNILNHAQFHGESHAKLVFLNTCLAFQQVAPALIAAGVDCVVGFYSTNGSASI